HDERRAGVIDDVLAADQPEVQSRRDDGQRRGADRDVDVEDPVPADDVGEPATYQRTSHGGHAEDGAEVALVAAAVTRRDDVADDCEADRHETTAADTLDGAEDDQLRHVLRETAERGADEEDDDRELVDALPAIQVGD